MLAGFGSATTTARRERRLDDVAVRTTPSRSRSGRRRRRRRPRAAPPRRSARGRPRASGAGRFPIGAHDLLVVRDDARLARRRPVVEREHRPTYRQSISSSSSRTRSPSASLPTPPTNVTARAERAQVVGDVARAAERERVIVHRDDRHRRLGRDARDAAPDPLVDHHVADRRATRRPRMRASSSLARGTAISVGHARDDPFRRFEQRARAQIRFRSDVRRPARSSTMPGMPTRWPSSTSLPRSPNIAAPAQRRARVRATARCTSPGTRLAAVAAFIVVRAPVLERVDRRAVAVEPRARSRR